jgi:acetoin utilization protein AcuB
MRLADVMTSRVLTVSPEESAERAFSLMWTKRVRHLVVQSKGRVVGVLSDRDIGGDDRAELRKSRTVGEVMTPYAVRGEPEMPVRQAANLMRGWTIGCLPVMKGDQLVGIVTTSDLLRLIGRGAVRPPISGHRRERTSRSGAVVI